MITEFVNEYVFPIFLFGGFLFLYSQMARGQYASTDQNLVTVVEHQPISMDDGSDQHSDAAVDSDEELTEYVPATQERYENMTDDQLLTEAKRLGLKANSRWKRETLIRKIKEVIS